MPSEKRFSRESVEIVCTVQFPVHTKSAGIAFEVEPELDRKAADELVKTAEIPAFEDDSPLPVLVSRAEIDMTKRNDGIGNALSVSADSEEKTCKIFISRCNVRKKFKEGKLL